MYGGLHIGVRTEQILWNVCGSSLASTVGKWELTYEGCPESIQPFWISREPVVWPWCNLADNERRPCCASVKSLSRGLVSRQWDAFHWVCVLCDRRMHNGQASRSASSRQCACAFYSSHAGFFFWQSITSHHPGLSAPIQPRFGYLRLLAFPKANIAVKREKICECDSHTVHKLSQRRLTADWLAPRESDCSRMHSKVSPDWLPSYIKATRSVLEIFKMAVYFLDSPRKTWVYASSTKPVYHPNFRPSLIVKSSSDVHSPSSNMKGQTLRLNHLSFASFSKGRRKKCAGLCAKLFWITASCACPLTE
jgi:hypothetical protein